jgi:HK97 family phage major capsid protein
MEDLNKELEGLKNDLTNVITKEVSEKANGIGADIKVLKDEQDKVKEQLKEISAAASRNRFGINNIDETSFKSQLHKALKEKESSLKNYKSNRSQIHLDLKAVGDIGSGNFTTSGTQTFNGPQILPGVARRAYEQFHMSDLFSVSSTQNDSIAVIRGVAGEGAPTYVATGGLKPQSDADWQKVIVPVSKIAHYYTIPEEWLEDTAWLANDITETGLAELKLLEDTKIISNSGAGEFTGLVQNSTAYAAPTGMVDMFPLASPANNYDVLVSAWTQLKNAKRNPNFVLVDHDSYAKMILSKSTTGEYVFGAPNIAMPNIFGIPVYASTATALADKFIMGDSSQAAIAVRAGVSVRFYDQHASNAIYNLVTVVIEERIAFIVKRTDAFVYGDFSDAVASLTAAS